MIKLHLDILFNSVLTNIQPRAPGIRYEKDVTCSLDPVKFKGDTYQLYGTADYVLEYDEREKGAANLVVLSAGRLGFKCSEERPNYACCGMAQIVALMCKFSRFGCYTVLINGLAMIHHHRKTHEQGDCTVYGICTDLIDFWFFQIDEKGEVCTVQSLASSNTNPEDRYRSCCSLLRSCHGTLSIRRSWVFWRIYSMKPLSYPNERQSSNRMALKFKVKLN